MNNTSQISNHDLQSLYPIYCRLWNSLRTLRQKRSAKSAYLWQLRAAGLSRCSELCPTTFSRSRRQSSPLHSYWTWLLRMVITLTIVAHPVTPKAHINQMNIVYIHVLIAPCVILGFFAFILSSWPDVYVDGLGIILNAADKVQSRWGNGKQFKESYVKFHLGPVKTVQLVWFFNACLLLFSFTFLTPLFFSHHKSFYLYNFLRSYLFTIYARLVGKFSWLNNLTSMEGQNRWQRCLLSDILCNANSNNFIFALL